MMSNPIEERSSKVGAEAREAALAAKRDMTPPPPAGGDPGGGLLRGRAAGRFLPDHGEVAVTVRSARRPQASASLGVVGAFVKVASDEPFIPGTLVVRVDREKLDAVSRQSLRLVRWDDRESTFRLVQPSGPGRDGGYAWARITAPGRYGVIGLRADPFVLVTIRTLAAARELLPDLPKELHGALHQRICELALCSPNGGDPGRCEECLKLPRPFDLPEFDLIPERLRGDSGWESIGPVAVATDQGRCLSGPVRSLALDPSQPDGLLVGSANGGLWRLASVAQNAGPGWTPLTDQSDSLVVRALAVASADDRILYIADGLRQVLRSANRGTSWSRTGCPRFRFVHRILVHPADPDHLYIASGSCDSDDAVGEMGVWRSLDGGATWTKLLAGDVTDAAMDPVEPSILYAGVRHHGLCLSTNRGHNWDVALPFVSEPVHGGSMIKLALGQAATDAERTVVVKFGQEVFVNRHGGRRRTQRGGGPWASKGWRGGDGHGDQSCAVAVDPFDDEIVLAGGRELVRTETVSQAGGGSWTTIASRGAPHEDQYCLEFDPTRPGVVCLGNRGGIFRSTDGGRTWNDLNRGLVTHQFLDAAIGHGRALGSTSSSGIIASAELTSGEWHQTEGETLEQRKIHADPHRDGLFYVLHRAVGRRRVPGDIVVDWGSFQPYSIAVDPSSEATVLVGTADRIMRLRSADYSDTPTWEDPGSWSETPIAAIAFAPGAAGIAYAISQSGAVHHEPDVNRPSWGAWTQTGSWEITGVRALAVNAFDDRRVYAITGDQIARSPDRGATWIPIAGSDLGALPDSPLHSVLADPRDGQVLYLGAKIGVFVSRNEGASWHVYDQGLANAPIVQLGWSDGDLVAVTHGRGIWRRSV
jgi:photosystem II stability/assembly factor-like uncharacterized protein